MKIRVWCERDKCIGFDIVTPEAPVGKCPICGDELKVSPPAAPDDRVDVGKCWRCGCPNLYVEKSFPQALGCLVMVTSAAVAIYFAEKTYGLSFMGIIVLDFVLYFLVPTRAVCYQCSAEYLGAPKNPRHKGYDLLIAGKYADSEDVGGPAGH
ncbi:MAG: hypothetical protein FD180_1309 [Planctomycetota bacterium]|nr:MAG: hypothetical protein FD180_1309 [Planctomycetota bacterium]